MHKAKYYPKLLTILIKLLDSVSLLATILKGKIKLAMPKFNRLRIESNDLRDQHTNE